MKQVVAGGTADVVLEIVDDDGDMQNADGTPTVDIIDAAGTTDVSGAAMTHEATGVYFYPYATSTTGPYGVYKALCTADVDSSGTNRPEIAAALFEVVPQ